MRRSIRLGMWLSLAELFLLAILLAGAGFYAVYLYKNQVRDVAWRASVLPVASTLSSSVGNLRTVYGELQGIRRSRLRLTPIDTGDDRVLLENQFRKTLFDVHQTYGRYREMLERRVAELHRDDNFQREFSTLHDIRLALQDLDRRSIEDGWGADSSMLGQIEERLTELQKLTDELPNLLHGELQGYTETMKRRARWLNGIMLGCVLISSVLMLMLIRYSYSWIFRPLGILIKDSRKIAEGDFEHRIDLPSKDEMADLAEAMNHMTERFAEIRRDLDEKVKLRSRELIRSERLASVGFLAAGVAHEINNPLTSISTCAELLQRYVVPALEKHPEAEEETETAREYLRMIDEEAFRCKGITDKLLSFARTERKERERTNLVPLIHDIVEMTCKRGEFKSKNVKLDMPKSLFLSVNPQEIKQVVLNLLANALSCTESDGKVTLRLRQEKQGKREFVVLTVSDNGCGMDRETLKNVFEPFFTRREQGQGTGIGLSITHRIVEEHQGRIEAHSSGPNRGASFVVELPTVED